MVVIAFISKVSMKFGKFLCVVNVESALSLSVHVKTNNKCALFVSITSRYRCRLRIPPGGRRKEGLKEKGRKSDNREDWERGS